ncbi:MAG: hypothetical protein K0S24_309 [Sphingobacterium sp.]|jgi:hypothetical protein|nr:hypothetical protein [Sphingobacterium sp.]
MLLYSGVRLRMLCFERFHFELIPFLYKFNINFVSLDQQKPMY